VSGLQGFLKVEMGMALRTVNRQARKGREGLTGFSLRASRPLRFKYLSDITLRGSYQVCSKSHLFDQAEMGCNQCQIALVFLRSLANMSSSLSVTKWRLKVLN